MATRKQKIEDPANDIPVLATDAKSVMRKKGTTYPKVVKGTHLTVTTYADGKTVLQWDDKALLREVREALASVGSKPKKAAPKKATAVVKAKPKAKPKAKKVEEPKTKRKTKEKK